MFQSKRLPPNIQQQQYGRLKSALETAAANFPSDVVRKNIYDWRKILLAKNIKAIFNNYNFCKYTHYHNVRDSNIGQTYNKIVIHPIIKYI